MLNPLLIEFLSSLRKPEVHSPERGPTMQERPISNISKNVAKQWKRGIIHALARMTLDGEHPRPLEQKVSSFNRFHASFSKSPVVSRSKVFFMQTYVKLWKLKNLRICHSLLSVEICQFVLCLLNCALKMKKNLARCYHASASFILK